MQCGRRRRERRSWSRKGRGSLLRHRGPASSRHFRKQRVLRRCGSGDVTRPLAEAAALAAEALLSLQIEERGPDPLLPRVRSGSGGSPATPYFSPLPLSTGVTAGYGAAKGHRLGRLGIWSEEGPLVVLPDLQNWWVSPWTRNTSSKTFPAAWCTRKIGWPCDRYSLTKLKRSPSKNEEISSSIPHTHTIDHCWFICIALLLTFFFLYPYHQLCISIFKFEGQCFYVYHKFIKILPLWRNDTPSPLFSRLLKFPLRGFCYWKCFFFLYIKVSHIYYWVIKEKADSQFKMLNCVLTLLASCQDDSEHTIEQLCVSSCTIPYCPNLFFL
jgi:hypothetical protein